MVQALLMSGLAAFGGIDINGAHTSHVRAAVPATSGGHVPRPRVVAAPALPPRGLAHRAADLAYRKADTIAIGVRGTEGPHTVYGGSEREPNGSGDLLLAKDDGPRWIRRAYELNGDDGSELGYQGLSMVVTTAAARR